jgi:hypothetical protein
MESKERSKRTIEYYEKRGAELEKDITKHALYYLMSLEEIFRRWMPEPEQKAN